MLAVQTQFLDSRFKSLVPDVINLIMQSKGIELRPLHEAYDANGWAVLELGDLEWLSEGLAGATAGV